MYQIVGLDAGNHEIKVVGEKGAVKILSDIGEGRERKLSQLHGGDDVEFIFNGRWGFAGTLARYESEFNGSIMGDSKAHEDTLIRVLVGLWKYGGSGTYRLVVGQPISKHEPGEKEKIKRMLKGKHEIKINGCNQLFNIESVEVAAEGGAAFWSNPLPGLVRIIDCGSGTVNCASLIDGRYIDRESFTLKFGMNSTMSKDKTAMVRGIAVETSKKWGREDSVVVCGGAAADVTPFVREIFPNAKTVTPVINNRIIEPVYSNAVGFFKIGKKIYGY